MTDAHESDAEKTNSPGAAHSRRAEGKDHTLKIWRPNADLSVVEQLEAHAGSGHGRRRLYVTTSDGRTVGWVDLLTGQTQLDDPLLLERFEAAVAQWQARNGQPLPGQRKKAERTREFGDLAENLPGVAARAHSRRLRAQAPLRSFLSRLVGVRTQERAWRVQADGEDIVWHDLARLDTRWRVLHAIRVGGVDIDHLVIGPSGVHTVDTRHHPGGRISVARHHVRVNSRAVGWIHESRRDAERAGLLLSAASGSTVAVQPIIAVVGARRMTFQEHPKGILVVPHRELRLHLESEPPVLSARTVDLLHSVARRPQTWIGH
jgi:hypothetical protein